MATGRNTVGVDLSPLATFIADVKTTPIREKSLEKVSSWAEEVVEKTKAKRKSAPSFWSEEGYQKDIPWTLRQIIEAILEHILDLPRKDQRRFAQCVLLKTAQWAIDCKEQVPSVEQFRHRFIEYTYESIVGMN